MVHVSCARTWGVSCKDPEAFEGYVLLIQYLLSHGANPNAFCRRGGVLYDRKRTGTALDVFAPDLRNCESPSHTPSRLTQSSVEGNGERIYDTLVAWGGEFSRPLPSIFEGTRSVVIGSEFQWFATDVSQLQSFPELIECKSFPISRRNDLRLMSLVEISSVRS